MLAIDPAIATVAGNTDCIKLYFGYWLGLLPYFHLDREAYLLPYMTRDFITMKRNERAETASLGKKVYLTAYIILG